MIHENAMTNFKIGAISEARMREYDEMCLTEDSETDNKTDHSEEIEHIDFAAI